VDSKGLKIMALIWHKLSPQWGNKLEKEAKQSHPSLLPFWSLCLRGVTLLASIPQPALPGLSSANTSYSVFFTSGFQKSPFNTIHALHSYFVHSGFLLIPENKFMMSGMRESYSSFFFLVSLNTVDKLLFY
jgi:hypothetical protein